MLLQEAFAGVRFLVEVPAHLRTRLTIPEAERILAARLASREQDVVATLRRNVFDVPESPYLPLLSQAGCAFGDVERLLTTEGVEGGLKALYCAGVYLTIDEFKGRTPVVRGSQTLDLQPRSFRNPRSRGPRVGESSGRTGHATARHVELEDARGQAVNKLLGYAAQGEDHWREAKWSVPGASSIGVMLDHVVMGQPYERWFTPVEPSDRLLHPRYRWAARGVRWASHLVGPSIPEPEFVPLDDPSPIVHWMAGHLAEGRTPLISGYSSMGVRVSLAAQRMGVDLTGGHVFVSGEPFTPARHAAVVASGLHPIPSFGSSETGTIGRACVTPACSDDLHFMRDLHAVIQPGDDAVTSVLPTDALLLTSIRETSRYVLLNVSLGDTAVLEDRHCGCPMEAHGWSAHVHSIRSHMRITAGGMALPDHVVARVLDEVLPGRFGGAPTQYQLAESESADGSPQLDLVVHPDVGQVHDDEVIATFLEAVGRGDGIERITSEVWRGGKMLRVVRRTPVSSRDGKAVHVVRNRGRTTEPRPDPALVGPGGV